MSAPTDPVDTPKKDFVEVLDPPFNHPDADIIVRSISSCVDFPVVKAFLVFASPLWREMFAIPTDLGKESQNEKKGNLPVVPFQEDKETLGILLRLCYPVASGIHRPKITSILVAGRVCSAAQRHCVEGVERLIMDQLLSAFLHTQPLSLFAFSWRFEMREEVKKAAKMTLLKPLNESTYLEELEWITAGTYLRLTEYHIQCGEVASALAKDLKWITPDPFIYCEECKMGWVSKKRTSQVFRWLIDFKTELSQKLKGHPCRSTVEDQKQVEKALVQASACPGCRTRAPEALRVVVEALAAEVEKATDRVEFVIPF